MFRRDSVERFNEEFCYGRRPKVELFWRLGVPGKWDRWVDEEWDQPRRAPSAEAYSFGAAGWVARLSSGMHHLEAADTKSFIDRGTVRVEAIMASLDQLDRKLLSPSRGGRGVFLSDPVAAVEPESALVPRLREMGYLDFLAKEAESALGRGPHSVVDKTSCAPSGDMQDYWHPAPYWWPDPNKKDGLPYVRRDGVRVPGTILYEPDGEKYDRTRLQRVFDDSMTLVLAGRHTGRMEFIDHAVRIFERFFVQADTRLNPNLDYAQVRMGHGGNKGSHTGVIEFKDLYYYLDVVGHLELTCPEISGSVDSFRGWLEEYLQWLKRSLQGLEEKQARNNHGTYYDLQVASIASFLGDYGTLRETFVRAQSRISQQFSADGAQPEELSRTISAHYCFYNLQGWLSLCRLGRANGFDLWAYESRQGASVRRAVDWLLRQHGAKWPYRQIEDFDEERYYPLWHHARMLGWEGQQLGGVDLLAVKPLFHPHDGIMPYWALLDEAESPVLASNGGSV